MKPTWVLSALDAAHVGPMNLFIREEVYHTYHLLQQSNTYEPVTICNYITFIKIIIHTFHVFYINRLQIKVEFTNV